MKKKGKVYMLPCPIVEDGLGAISQDAIMAIHQITHFVVERARTARRYIKQVGHPEQISGLQIFELEKNDPRQGLHQFLSALHDGVDIGVLSEAGCPGIADPGHLAVRYAHAHGIEVVPMVGPSSILLALIASGMNGQQFAFHGYLPNKAPQLSKKLKDLEQTMNRTGQTQVFMEAPYRNAFILEHCQKTLQGSTALCIACDIGSNDQFILTQKMNAWNGTDWSRFHKRPAVFLMGKID